MNTEHDAVVFWLWRGLAYRARMALGLGMMAAGLALQAAMAHWLPGCVLVALGNALLLVRGYHNRIDPAVYDARAEWERVESSRIEQIKTLHARMRQWDRSAFDISSPWGVCLLGALALLTWLIVAASALPGVWKQIIAINAVLLVLPHWITGTRRVLKQPALLIKIAAFEGVLPVVEGQTVEWYVLLKGAEARLPQDIKLRIRLPQQKDAFLGLYGQTAINNVQGHSYPYFYAVLVARKEFGLKKYAGQSKAGAHMLLEYSQQDDVEVLVIRQATKQSAGYYTHRKHASAIMAEGLRLAQRVNA